MKLEFKPCEEFWVATIIFDDPDCPEHHRIEIGAINGRTIDERPDLRTRFVDLMREVTAHMIKEAADEVISFGDLKEKD